jgi:hypothetical protein
MADDSCNGDFFADRTTVKMLGINSSGSGSSTQIVQQDRPLEPDPQDCGIMGCLVLYIYKLQRKDVLTQAISVAM